MNKINVTDARKEMSSFFDSVIHEKPIILKRRKYEAVLAEKSLLQMMLEYAKVPVIVTKANNGNWIYRASNLEVFGEAETKADAEASLCDKLFDYANEVYDNFMYYYYGKKIQGKLPYIFNILLCEDAKGVKAILTYEKDANNNGK